MELSSDKPDGAEQGLGNPRGPEPLEKRGAGEAAAGARQEDGRGRGARGPYRKSKGSEPGGYGHLYGNFYEQAQARRQKALGFLQKDLFQIGKPDLRGFLNINHAYECLLPYHVFWDGVYEDMLFANSKEVLTVPAEIEEVVPLLRGLVEAEGRQAATEETLVCELLLYYQQRYINSTYGDGQQQRARRYRQQLSRRNTVLRLRVDDAVREGNNVDVRDGRLYFKRGG